MVHSNAEFDITYDNDRDIHKKTVKYQTICDLIRRTLRENNPRQIKFYKIIALLTILKGSEYWAPRIKDMRQLEASEAKFFRAVTGCTRQDSTTGNVNVYEEVGVQSLSEYCGRIYRKMESPC